MRRPTQASGRSVERKSVPSPLATANTASPISAVSSKLRSTEPRSSAGIASTGRASTTANTSRLTAVSAATVAAGGWPAWTSILYCSAEPSAPPPGATLASALPASCEVITGRQCRARSASRCSAHRQASEASCSAAIAASEPIEKRRISRHELSVSRIDGKTR